MPANSVMNTPISLESKFFQIMNSGNDKLYICNASKTMHGFSISVSGEGRSLKEAMADARNNADAIYRDVTQNTMSASPARSDTLWHSEPRSVDARNGCGDKPASERQIGLVRRIAEERGVNADSLAANGFGKRLSALTGAEANQLIHEIKGGRR